MKSILITGCGQGSIGAALAAEFSQRGHTVFASGRSLNEIDPELLDAGKHGQVPRTIHTLELDVTSQASIDAAFQLVSAATGGRLDVLINNAGVISVMPFADEPIEAVKRLYDVNVFGVWAVTQTFLPLLVASRGLIADLGSIDPVACPPYFSAYSSSKAATECINRTIRRELAPFGVRVVNIKSGSVGTRLFENCPPVPLPSGSLYSSLRQWIEGRAFLEFSLSRQSSIGEYSRILVDKLLSDRCEPVIWIGGMSLMTWIYSLFGWETAMVSQTAVPHQEISTKTVHRTRQ